MGVVNALPLPSFLGPRRGGRASLARRKRRPTVCKGLRGDKVAISQRGCARGWRARALGNEPVCLCAATPRYLDDGGSGTGAGIDESPRPRGFPRAVNGDGGAARAAAAALAGLRGGRATIPETERTVRRQRPARSRLTPRGTARCALGGVPVIEERRKERVGPSRACARCARCVSAAAAKCLRSVDHYCCSAARCPHTNIPTAHARAAPQKACNSPRVRPGLFRGAPLRLQSQQHDGTISYARGIGARPPNGSISLCDPRCPSMMVGEASSHCR